MSVYVVRHQHPAERCPAADFTDGAGLLNHLSPANAAWRGVRIRCEAMLANNAIHQVRLADAPADGREQSPGSPEAAS